MTEVLGNTGRRNMKRQARCSVEGCERPYAFRGFCSSHYSRALRYGDPLGGRGDRADPVHLAAFLKAHVGYAGDECVIWPFARRPDGYAAGKIEHQGVKLNPYAYLLAVSTGQTRPSPKHQAAHNCGNGRGGCVNPKHLRWATPLENTRDKEAHGTMLRGERAGNAKLSEKDVRDIMASPERAANLARAYNVTESAISRIRNRQTWKTLDPERGKWEGNNTKRGPYVDWRALFARYVSHVAECEGAHFLSLDLANNEAERRALSRVIEAEEARWPLTRPE